MKLLLVCSAVLLAYVSVVDAQSGSGGVPPPGNGAINSNDLQSRSQGNKKFQQRSDGGCEFQTGSSNDTVIINVFKLVEKDTNGNALCGDGVTNFDPEMEITNGQNVTRSSSGAGRTQQNGAQNDGRFSGHISQKSGENAMESTGSESTMVKGNVSVALACDMKTNSGAATFTIGDGTNTEDLVVNEGDLKSTITVSGYEFCNAPGSSRTCTCNDGSMPVGTSLEIKLQIRPTTGNRMTDMPEVPAGSTNEFSIPGTSQSFTYVKKQVVSCEDGTSSSGDITVDTFADSDAAGVTIPGVTAVLTRVDCAGAVYVWDPSSSESGASSVVFSALLLFLAVSVKFIF